MIKRLFLLLGLLPVAAAAQVVPPDVVYVVTVGTKTIANKSGDAACAAAVPLATSTSGNVTTTWTFSGTSINASGGYRCAGTYVASYADGRPSTSGGPQNLFTASKVTCTTAKPFYDFTKFECVATEPPPPPPDSPCGDKNEFIRRWNYSGSGPFPAPNHYNGCAIAALKMLVCRKDTASAGSYCMWLVVRTGAQYNGPPDGNGGEGSNDPENENHPPVPSPPIVAPSLDNAGGDTGGGGGSRGCPAGSVQAGSDSSGTPICMGTGTKPPGTKPPPPKIESEKNETMPDGSVKNTKTTVTTNSDGSKTTDVTVTITKPDGTKETSGSSNTGTNTAGQQGTADKPDAERNDLCKQNPTLSICRESSVTGTCGQITCVGDAIQCATLRAAAIMQCEQAADKEALEKRPEVAAGNSILNGTDSMKPAIDAAIKGTEVDLSAQRLDQGGFVGGGSCFPDRSFSVLGKTVTVSFARVCQDIQPLRAAIMACAFIVAYLIVGRSVIQG